MSISKKGPCVYKLFLTDFGKGWLGKKRPNLKMRSYLCRPEGWDTRLL